MKQHEISVPTYIVVCGILILLTFLTIGISLVALPGAWHRAFGLLIAVCKATLVALFFMHLIISSRLTWIVVAVSIAWVVLLFGLTLTDYFTRGLVPSMPGH